MTYRRVKIIEQSPFTLHFRLELALVYAQQKPATCLLATSPINTAENGVCALREDVVRRSIKAVSSTKIPYELGRPRGYWRPYNGTKTFVEGMEIFIGKDRHTLDKLLRALNDFDEREMGRCFGFPETAIQAYLGERQPFMGTLPLHNHPIDMFTGFVFSRDHWKEEFRGTSVRWHDTVKKMSRALYRETVRHTRGNKKTKSNLFWRDEYLLQNKYFLS